MPCYHPLRGYRSRRTTENGKRGITFSPTEGFPDLQVSVPCGQCIGCRLEKSRQWAMRCVHEMKQHADNSFITLTFDDNNLNPEGSLVKSDFQNFMKRLRKNTGAKIRYFHCGEYGDQLKRPHHHAILFGYDFTDKKYFKKNGDYKLYSSDILDKAWQNKGHSLIGEANFETAAYVARYVLKKITGPGADEYYDGRQPEYTTMSRRPGIGSEHYHKYKHEMWPDDFIVMNNKKMKPPLYYEKLLDEEHPETLKQIKSNRIIQAMKHPEFDNLERLYEKESVKLHAAKRNNRQYENSM